MKITDFLHYNEKCPVCQEPLTVLMQWMSQDFETDDKLFISSKENNIYTFIEHPLNTKQMGLFGQKTGDNKEIIMKLQDEGNSHELKFNSLSSEKIAKNQGSIYFYSLCNLNGINELGAGDYNISMYYACYYRSSTYTKIICQDGKLCFENSACVHPNREENFCITTKHDDLKKIYLVTMDYGEKKTVLWYYTITSEQETKEDYMPNVFENEMPLLSSRPDLGIDNRDRLISRMDSWINLS